MSNNDSAFEVQEYVFQSTMYADCLQYTILDSNATQKCAILSFTGGLVASLIVPSIIFAIIGELLLMYTLVVKSSKSSRRFVYVMGQALNNIAFAIGICYCMTFQSKGLAWLGYEANFLENKSVKSCKVYRFMYSIIMTGMSNVMFLDAYERALALQCKCYAPVIKSKNALIFTVFWIGTIVLTIPVYISSGHWILDGRLICDIDPRWTYTTTHVLAIHDVFFVSGLIQSVATIILAVSMARELGKLDNTIDFLQTATQLPRQLRTMTADTTRLLRESQRDCWGSLAFFLSSASVRIVHSVIRARYHYELYTQIADNHTPMGVVTIYAFDAAEDLTKIATLVISCYHYWIYFYHLPSLRLWVIGDKSRQAREIFTMREYLLPPDSDFDDFNDVFDNCVYQVKKSNQSAYKKLSMFKRSD